MKTQNFLKNRTFSRAPVLLLAATCCSGWAANILVNPGFEANSGQTIPTGWTRLTPTNAQPGAHYAIEAPAHSGAYGWKQWNASYVANATNVAALGQEFGSAPGSIYQASGWMYSKSGDWIQAGNAVWLEVAFLGSSGNLVALFKSPEFTRDAGNDTWMLYTVNQSCDLSRLLPPGDPNYPTYAVTGTVSQIVAPVGTVKVRFRYVYSAAQTAGGSANFDDAVLDQVSGPQPPVIANLLPQNMIFINPADGISFNVNSPSGFTIDNNAIRVVLNGTNDVSGSLSISGAAASKNVLYSGLQSNLAYTVSITATDSFGFSASASTYFETTWVGAPPITYIWEVEDWDFDSGHYLNNPELCNTPGNPNCYFGKIGVEDVDEHYTTGGNSHLYRPDDPMPTAGAGDLLRKNLFLAGRTDYRIDPFIQGEWVNYTRDFPNSTNWVLARVATGEGLSGTLTLSVVNADTSTTDLGTFTVTSGRGWTAYENVFLTDANGNRVNVVLDGKTTLRVTAGGNLLPNFFMLTPAQVDLPVISDLYPNGDTPFQYTNELGFSVTATGTTFPSGGIRLILDGFDVSPALQITGAGATRNVVYPALLPNAIHTAAILATNALGRGIAVTNLFDTFSEDNYMFEAEDFDYDGGVYVTDWFPDAYAGQGAVTNIDFQHSPIEGEAYAYRSDGIPEEKVQNEFLRQVFLNSGATDYQLAWFGGGDWANYTREYPTNTFVVYARSGGFGSYSMELSRVVSGAGTVNQATSPLGYWKGNGKGNQVHEWVLLTDAGGVAPAPVTLNGLATLRLSTSTGNCHPGYFMFVPAAGIRATAVRSGPNVVVSFPTQTGVVYRVFCRDSLAGGDWNLLGTVLGDGAVRGINDPAVGAQRYYKVSAP